MPSSPESQPPVLCALPGAEALAAGLRRHWACASGALELHRFPDGEACPRFGTALAGRDVALVAVPGAPDAMLFALHLCARVARELGAARVGLVLPYLPYMRQDTRFGPGEGTSARHVAALLASCADWLATVDPHLHRFASLGEVYPIPTAAVAAAGPVAEWIRAHVGRPVLVGPDGESRQWVAEVAARLGCPHAVMAKVRAGDRDVSVVLADPLPPAHTPVLLDDIVSSGHTLVQAVGALRAAGAPAPVCVAVHALFAGDALALLQTAGARTIVSCNTVPHATNAIDISGPLARAAARLAAGLPA